MSAYLDYISHFFKQINRVDLYKAYVLVLLACYSSFVFSQPQVFWISDPVSPGETALITGQGFDGIESVAIKRLPDDAKIDKQTASVNGKSADILQLTEHSIKFQIPKSFMPGVYSFELSTKQNALTGYLNTPNVYWFQGDRGGASSRGGWVRVFGRNIVRLSSVSYLELTSQNKIFRLKPTNASLWDAKFNIPNNIPKGNYQIKLWNGNGSAETVKVIGSLLIKPLINHQRNGLVNVKKFGAKGDAGSDDTGALMKAISYANKHKKSGVYLPAGHYMINKAIQVPDGLSLSGESTDLTTLNWGDKNAPPPVLITGHSNFSLKNFTISVGKHNDIIRGGIAYNTKKNNDGENITIDGIRVRASNFLGRMSVEKASERLIEQQRFIKDGPAGLRLAGENIVVKNCDIYVSGRSIVLLRPVNSSVTANTFYNGRLGWYSIGSANKLIFENNHIIGADLQATGGGINTLRTNLPYTQNILFKRNILEKLLGWDGEAMTTDGNGGYYYGSAIASGSTMLDIDNKLLNIANPQFVIGATVFILKGEGAGFYAKVKTINQKQIYLDKHLPVDAGSRVLISIVPSQYHNLIIENEFIDTKYAIQLFGASLDFVIAGNKSNRTGGFFAKGLSYEGGVQPSWYNQFLNNDIASGSIYGMSALGIWTYKSGNSREVLNYASIVRNNQLSANSYIQVKGANCGYKSVSDTLIEKNVVKNNNVSLDVKCGVKDILIKDNEFSGKQLVFDE